MIGDWNSTTPVMAQWSSPKLFMCDFNSTMTNKGVFGRKICGKMADACVECYQNISNKTDCKCLSDIDLKKYMSKKFVETGGISHFFCNLPNIFTIPLNEPFYTRYSIVHFFLER